MVQNKTKASRIGIFSGSFDPVHTGHIAFALQTLDAVKLDKIFFAPESKPRRKEGVAHISHRIAMLKLATRAHPGLGVLEMPDKQFTVAKTLPRLKHKFPSDKLFYVCGSDMLLHMPDWVLIQSLLSNMGLVIGTRDTYNVGKINDLLARLPVKALETHVIISQLPSISARSIREAIAEHRQTEGLLASTKDYINKQWLYSAAPSKSS